jgi:hypothetical protein
MIPQLRTDAAIDAWRALLQRDKPWLLTRQPRPRPLEAPQAPLFGDENLPEGTRGAVLDRLRRELPDEARARQETLWLAKRKKR